MESKERKIELRDEKLGEYFLNLSNTAFGTTVLGVLVLILTSDKAGELLVLTLLIFGVLMTIVLAAVGDNFLKGKE